LTTGTEVKKSSQHIPCNDIRELLIKFGKVETRTDRNEEDIQRIFSIVSKLPYFIIGSSTIPTILILYQILSK